MVFCNHKGKQSCRWRRRKEARPEEILEAALELFTEKGFTATRMTDVAKKAGISKGTLYLYFDSKEAIFRALVQDVIAVRIEQEEALVDSFQGPSDVLLRQMINDWWDYIGNSRLSAIPKLIVSESGNFPELAEFFVNQVVRRARKLYAKAISRGVVRGEFYAQSPETVARLVIAPMVHMVIWMHSLQTFDDRIDAREYIDLHIEFILKNLVKQPGDAESINANDS